ncbi:MAG: LuxR C-terminal-related transcriptional regulator [Nocardiopsaceae bacterium]|nr:LuxR C-terminal-related transcriptional regulator [Nocardiopsaceae bacterium]
MSDPRHSLPPSSDEFIGRERDIVDLQRIVGTTRMVSLTGIGGIGKTRLAIRVARRSLPRFSDGVGFIDLSEAASPDQVVRVIARALRVLEDSGEVSADAIATVLRSRRMLLLLDTCERAITPLTELCHTLLLSCPDVHILATSRQPLHVAGETVWRVPPLSLPPRTTAADRHPAGSLTTERALAYEAVRLFSARARTARPSFEMTSENSGDIVEICRILDGVPLAIELAAARVRVLSVQQILHRLNDRFRLLVSTGQELPPRQRTLRAVLEWSHDLLTHPEQILLRRLAVLGTWDLRQAEYVCGHTGLDRGEIQDLLSSLIAKSLVVLEDETGGVVRYRLPDTVRAYAAERLADADEEDRTWGRCLAESVEWAESMAAALSRPLPWPDRLRYLHRLDHARENTTRLLAWALEHGHIDAGLRMCTALRPYWFVRGLVTEGVRHLARFLDRAGSATPPAVSAVRARALAVHAELCLDTEGVHTSRRLAHAALEASRSCGDLGARAIAFAALAVAALRTGDDAESRDYAGKALTAAREVPDHFTEVAALGTLSRLAQRSGDDETAERFMRRGVDAAQEIDARWCVAHCLSGLGVLSTRRGDLDGAGRYFAEALRIFAESGIAPEAARCAVPMGYLDLARGDISGARRRFSGYLRLNMASGRRGAIARSLEALAELALAEEQPERTVSLAGAAARLHEDLGQSAPRADSLRNRVEQTLAPDAAEKAWRAWRGRPLEQVVDNALSFPAARRALPSLLTPREKEIAALVGEGMSNRQIAEHLVISQATAARHIANIFRKLLITSRTQLADWSQKHGLGK